MDDWRTISLTVPPSHWKVWNRKYLGTVSNSGLLREASGTLYAKLQEGKKIGSGSFGTVRRYKRLIPSGEIKYVALKTPNNRVFDLFYEAMFQHRVREHLKIHGLERMVPSVIDIVRLEDTNDIWFTMDYIPGRLLGSWVCDVFQQRNGLKYFILMLLQLSILLEALESFLLIDHRDVKVDNLLVVGEPYEIPMTYKGVSLNYTFPFRIVLIDFGFSCLQKQLDVKDGRGDPPLDFCPKDGRDIFQILVSLWNMKRIRDRMNTFWESWIRKRISTTTSEYPCLQFTEEKSDILWLSTVTDDTRFKAPLCAPKLVLEECYEALEKL